MPVYEFRCRQCGVFATEMAMREASSTTACPTCGHTAERVYSNIVIWAGSPAVRGRASQGEVPRVMARDEWRAVATHKHEHRHPARPWQLGH